MHALNVFEIPSLISESLFADCNALTWKEAHPFKMSPWDFGLRPKNLLLFCSKKGVWVSTDSFLHAKLRKQSEISKEA